MHVFSALDSQAWAADASQVYRQKEALPPCIVPLHFVRLPSTTESSLGRTQSSCLNQDIAVVETIWPVMPWSMQQPYGARAEQRSSVQVAFIRRHSRVWVYRCHPRIAESLQLIPPVFDLHSWHSTWRKGLLRQSPIIDTMCHLPFADSIQWSQKIPSSASCDS